jgi:hypothetical protein
VDAMFGISFKQDPPPVKIGVVEFGTMPLVGASQKTTCSALFGNNKMENPFLCVN